MLRVETHVESDYGKNGKEPASAAPPAGAPAHARPGLRPPLWIIAAALGLMLMAAFAFWRWNVTDWRATHAGDLVAMHDALKENHPGAIDPKNAAFARWLEDGLSQARAREPKVEESAAYIASLIAYANGFGDTHVSVEPAFALPAPRWPGFIVALRAGQATVVDRDAKDAAAPPLSAVIETCDSETPAKLVAQRILPFGFDQRVPANAKRALAELFLERGNPLSPSPKSCVLTAAGKAQSLTLSYRALPADFATRYEAAMFGAPAKLGWSEPAPGVAWIAIPSFDYDDANTKPLRKVIDRLSAEVNRLKQGRAIVFDVRGNAGGSSLWGDEIRNILWYPEDVAKYAPRDPSGVDWRASPGNRDYMMNLISEVIPKVGSQSDVGLSLTRIAGGLSDAVAQKKITWREGNKSPGAEGGLTERRPRAEKPLFPAKVIMISNGSCASACLDFADRILQMPGTHIVGFATAGDGQYTESRALPLPSGKAVLHFPMKVYRGRPRGNMEVYKPDIAYDGPWTDAAVRRWLLDLIDKGKF